jgi:hypothetical protein
VVIPPQSDIRDLLELRDVEERGELSMIVVHDRVLTRAVPSRLALPVRPGQVSPEVVGPQKPPFNKYARRLAASSRQCEPPGSLITRTTLKQRGIDQPDDEDPDCLKVVGHRRFVSSARRMTGFRPRG